MLFPSKNKLHNVLIDSLGEPVFLFKANGAFRDSNKAARDILKTLGYADGRGPDNHEALLKILRLVGRENNSPFLAIGGKKYELLSKKTDSGIMLRLMPLHEDPHLMRLAAALEIMPWGLLTVDLHTPQRKILYCNSRMEDFLQTPSRKLIDRPLEEVLLMFGIQTDMKENIESLSPSHVDCESDIDGRKSWYRFHFIPYGRTINACLVVVEDASENKIMESQYFQAQRLEALGQLAGGVAHDFNNILSIIDGYARMGRKHIDKREDTENYLERIRQAVQRGAALTSQLLTFGSHKIDKDSVIDLGQLVRDQEPLLRPLMDATINLSIRTDDNVFVRVHSDAICQILLNLCINSRDAMPDGGNLIVEVRKSGEKNAVLRVIDTGTGMKPEIKARMFDPFFTTKDQGKGTGLGLSMVYGLVKDMKGEISVLTKEGSGTSISIELPLSERAPDFHEINEIGDQRDLKGLTALVAEDEPDLLNILSGTLEDMGAKVIKASNGNEALALQEKYDGGIDFLLTDVVMPDLNGIKLAELFKSMRPESQVMFMSGYPANGIMSRVHIPENTPIMPKPIDVNKLVSLIHEMANTSAAVKNQPWKKITGQWKRA